MGEESVDEEKRATLRRFAAVGAGGPLARLAGSDADTPDDTSSDVPAAIRGYLATTPGAHFSKLRDDLRLGTGEAQYHLRELAERDAVESWKDGDYRRYVPAGRFSDFERRALGYLRRDTARGLVVGLLKNPDATGTELAARLDVSAPTVSKHAAALADAGLLDRSDGYALTRPETTLLLLVRFADSFGADAVALAAEADDLVAYRD
ncbi:MarR family transcriptional regulator [Haloglomus irregulare]|jgi:predicted transcriptional regulator|uniref:MarR family transcriptional regulator n=1 Tax=Haloglomus irregulare TaxID=2234134 RepID=A0A554MW11_9EURY|nr:MarR family transcriptional regulator [Haloglomus irregulare]TSD09315.1 MarR family transcriptional regulator [Haloglomus irregulare]